jgi:hypothetical protein
MLIECLILRDGNTQVSVRGHNYDFMPIPGALDGEQTTSVCNISDQDTVDYLIGNPNKVPPIKGRTNFRPYRPQQAQTELLERRNKNKTSENKFKGYSVDVLKIMGNDKGYVVKHNNNNIVKFCGSNGIWTDDVQKIWPFAQIGDAEQFLKAFVNGQPVETDNKGKIPYSCGECEMIFEDPVKLADHWKAAHAPVTESKEIPKTSGATESKVTEAPEKKSYITPGQKEVK